MSYALVDGVVICAHSDEDPTDGEWAEYLCFLTESLARDGARAVWVVTRGGGLSGMQRRLLAEAMAAAVSEEAVGEVRTALCTRSTIMRSMVSALNWLSRSNTRAFAFDQRDDALAYLRVPTERRAALSGAVDRQLQAFLRVA